MLNLQDMLKAPTLDTLAAAWIQAKASEDRAKQQRLDIEASILRLVPVKDEGTVHDDVAGLKLAVTYKLTRSVDAERLKESWATLTANVQAAFTWKPDIAMTQLRALEKAATLDYAEALHFITSKPAKPAVKVEAK